VIFFLNSQKSIQLFYLCQSNRCMQFTYAEIVTNERVQIGPTVNALTGRIADATTRLLAAAPAQWVAFHETA